MGFDTVPFPQGFQPHIRGFFPYQKINQNCSDEGKPCCDKKGGAQRKPQDDSCQNGRQYNHGQTASGSADADGERPVTNEPAVHQDGYRNHASQTVADARHGCADAELGVGVRETVDGIGRAAAQGGDAGSEPVANPLVIQADHKHGKKSEGTPQCDQGRCLRVGQLACLDDIGQENRKTVGSSPHGNKYEKRADSAHDPTIKNLTHNKTIHPVQLGIKSQSSPSLH